MITIESAVTAYLKRKSTGSGEGSGSGTYASNAESILRRWSRWLESERDVTTMEAISIDDLEAFAERLAELVERDEYAASTAQTYYAVVRAFLAWCLSEELIAENPATADASLEALPTADVDRQQPFWSGPQRRKLEAYVRDRAADATDADPDERIARLREAAMVAALAHAGLRGGELFRVPEDDRRTGATWDDVDFYTGTIRVLGRSQRLEDVPLPAPARRPLRRYRVVLDPPTSDWPLFPTRHAPSIARRVRSVLSERGHDEATIDEIMASGTAIEVARERSIPPPAITTEGARSILRRLCDEAGVDVDGDYLKPRGARRALEDEPRRSAATTARTALRETFVEQSMVLAEESDGSDDGRTDSMAADHEPEREDPEA